MYTLLIILSLHGPEHGRALTFPYREYSSIYECRDALEAERARGTGVYSDSLMVEINKRMQKDETLGLVIYKCIY